MDMRTLKGLSVEVICTASGQPNPSVTWKKKQGTKPIIIVNPNMNLHFSGHSELVLPLSGSVMRIQEVKESDAGSYSCIVGNGVGQDLVANFLISVKGT